jgi:hypothetical protein
LRNSNEKKDPRLAMPGYDLYCEMRPILPWWRFIIGGLVVVFLGAGAAAGLPIGYPDIWWPLIFVVITVGGGVLLGLYNRGKAWTVGIRCREGKLLVGDGTKSAPLVASRFEFTNTTSLYVERRGGRIELKRMTFHFSTPEDARKVVDWLKEQPPWNKQPSLPGQYS